jgi:hypothetical protein
MVYLQFHSQESLLMSDIFAPCCGATNFRTYQTSVTTESLLEINKKNMEVLSRLLASGARSQLGDPGPSPASFLIQSGEAVSLFPSSFF